VSRKSPAGGMYASELAVNSSFDGGLQCNHTKRRLYGHSSC